MAVKSGKVFNVGGLGQKVSAAVLTIGVACTSIGCDRDGDDELTREKKRRIQYVNGLLPVQEKDYTTYVHVESKYSNTRQRVVHEGDVVYFVQDGGVFGGVVERHVHPERVIVAQLYGTDPQGNRIYLQDSYTLFTHRYIWTTESEPIADHPDLGVDAIVVLSFCLAVQAHGVPRQTSWQ